MHGIEKIKEMLEKEIELISMDEKLSMASLEKLHKLTDTVKNLDKIEMLEEVGDEYSNTGSYARYRRRDSMGRYAREGGYSRDGDGNRIYSRGRGYSRESKDEMIDRIEEMMHNADSDKERTAYKRALAALENS